VFEQALMIEYLTEMFRARVGLPASVVSWNNGCKNSVISWNA